MHYGQIR